jgi:hypothetical protein
MAMVRVGQVRVVVGERLVRVRVRVRLGHLPWVMKVLMMLVVLVAVLVLQRLVDVPVRVAHAQDHHDADPHHERGADGSC